MSTAGEGMYAAEIEALQVTLADWLFGKVCKESSLFDSVRVS
jgi:hypothetical protein